MRKRAVARRPSDPRTPVGEAGTCGCDRVSFGRNVIANVAVQWLGPASAFLTVFVVARLGGPTAQGEYAQLRAWIDLLVAVGSLGLPQGIIYVINVLGASPGRLEQWSRRWALGVLPIAFLASLGAARAGLLTDPGAAAAAMVAGTAAILVLHSLWRGIYLTRFSGARFALFTILPAVAALAGVAWAMRAGEPRLERALLLASLPVVAISFLAMRAIPGPTPAEPAALPWRPLFVNGIHALAQSLLMTAQPLAAYAFVRHAGGSPREVGFLNAGLFLVQGLTVPVSMIAPLLFVRWTASADPEFVSSLRRATPRLLALGAAGGVALAAVVGVVVRVVFGASYAPAIPAAQAVMLTLPLVVHLRVVAPAMHARGHPEVNTSGGFLRLGTFVLAALVLQRSLPPELAAAVAWSIAEVLASAWILRALYVLGGAASLEAGASAGGTR